MHPLHYAHTFEGKPWEPLFTPLGDIDPSDPRKACSGENGVSCPHCESLAPYHGHLNKVAWFAGKFASDMFSLDSQAQAIRQWGYLIGLWHDLGKFASKWQEYLKSKADPHVAEITEQIDHSSAGAQYAASQHALGKLLAYPIAGHHSGLLNADSEDGGACLRQRLAKEIENYSSVPEVILSKKCPTKLPEFLSNNKDNKSLEFSVSFFVRMLFSCLVDADYLATESFMNPDAFSARNRNTADDLEQIEKLVSQYIDDFGKPTEADTVNWQRYRVRQDCERASEMEPGLFTLTVPTGGGKTLSSLLFALRHARKYGQKHIIFVVPFTSIIEQNAQVIREIVEPLRTDSFTPLIEHHSNLSPERETTQSRLAAENWDAPIIMTTAVQFYESLYAAKTSRTRKLHHIANSVVILDEAQTLPVDYLHPCLRVLKELTDFYNTSVVLCTATQPAIEKNNDFPIGLEHCREIISDPTSLSKALERVKLKTLGNVSDKELVEKLQQHEQVLCIVNRRKHAQELYRGLGKDEANFHLSALMCPEHRSQVLAQVIQRLKEKLPVRLISTQLIEAGVDVDFPIVYRSMAGLDSITQAAGRCNRNGKLEYGTTYVFEPEDQASEVYFRQTAQVTRELAGNYETLLDPKAVQCYFDLYYYHQKTRWDTKQILDKSNLRFDRGNPKLPFYFQYKTMAENFQLINDWQLPIIIPFDAKAKKLVEDLRNPSIPLHRNLLRALQRYTVSVSPKIFNENRGSIESVRTDQFHIMICPKTHYSKEFGVNFDGTQDLIV